LLIAALVMTALPSQVRALADGGDQERPIRLYATAMAGPIGSLDAFGKALINERPTSGEQDLWGGELIESPQGASTQAWFERIGRVTLAGGTAVRFGVAPGSVLVASLLGGSITVKLDRNASAYVQAAGNAFTGSMGASFRVSSRGGDSTVEIIAGTVSAEQLTQPNYKIRPVDDQGRPVDLGRTLSVRARSTRQFQIQVTDENDRPVPDLPILFSLADPCLGSLAAGGATSLRKNTDRRGIAAVPIAFGAIKCLSSVSASVEGTNIKFTQEVNVSPAPSGFWTARNSLLIAAGAAAAATTAAVVSASDEGEPIQPVPPPRVRP
jgi:hypothetical protein